MQRVVVITGASSGIGREAAIELARRGWRVAVAGRDPQRTREVAMAVGGEAFIADFDDLDQVRQLGSNLLNSLPRIDVLVNNAGGILATRRDSSDGFELTLQRNVLAPALLTQTLMPALIDQRARIVHTSSVMNRIARIRMDDLDYTRRRFGGGWQPYADAKLGVVLYAKHLVESTGLENFPVHPGYVNTGFGPNTRASRVLMGLTRRLQISAQAGAAPIVHLVDTPELGVDNGTYFDGLLPGGAVHPSAHSAATVRRYGQAITSRVG